MDFAARVDDGWMVWAPDGLEAGKVASFGISYEVGVVGGAGRPDVCGEGVEPLANVWRLRVKVSPEGGLGIARSGEEFVAGAVGCHLR